MSKKIMSLYKHRKLEKTPVFSFCSSDALTEFAFRQCNRGCHWSFMQAYFTVLMTNDNIVCQDCIRCFYTLHRPIGSFAGDLHIADDVAEVLWTAMICNAFTHWTKLSGYNWWFGRRVITAVQSIGRLPRFAYHWWLDFSVVICISFTHWTIAWRLTILMIWKKYYDPKWIDIHTWWFVTICIASTHWTTA